MLFSDGPDCGELLDRPLPVQNTRKFGIIFFIKDKKKCKATSYRVPVLIIDKKITRITLCNSLILYCVVYTMYI